MTEARTVEDVLSTLRRFDPAAAALIERELKTVLVPKLPPQSPWHCVTDGAVYPGCGHCGPCRLAAPRVFADLHELRRLIEINAAAELNTGGTE